MAPANAALLANAGIPFSITAAGLKNKADFRKNLLKAVQYGLSKEQALQALTETPAKQLRVSSFSGALIPGAEANFFITDGDYFNEKTKLTESYIGSSRLSILPVSPTDIRGKYELSLGLDSRPLTLNISGKTDEPSYKLQRDTLKWDAKAVRSGDRITLSFSPTPKEKKSLIRLYGWQKGTDFAGSGELPDGTPVNWSAKYISGISDTVKKDSTQPKPQIGNIIYPFASFGRNELPKTADLVFRNATVWTNEQDGILENTDVWISGGKIKAVGKSLSAPGAAEIDAKGKHLSPGIIDEHSHIAISQGVNEGTQAVTSEVRIGDVLDCEDINIYRQLSGGVVASQLLHGSANPIGGQSALIKLRWGLAPEALKIEGADGFIKFALGENVKQSNWGDNRRTRFPQTRMGVEQVFTDAFTRAKAYKTELAGYTAGKGISPRRDLELEALCEILDRKRFITCHSYVQSEINMLMKTADSMGFKVNTFTHILEGYKVADKMKAHGAGGSTFSDWWAYKMEVQDAIPYNAAIMSKAGIVTAINSDDPEMGRRLNQEAGKINKYGNIPETEALKMITLNPAKLLHLDSRMGSIKPGKDADLVLWTDNPLSIYAKAEKTLVDGKIYFDRTEDLQLREALRKERARLINKMLTEKSKGAETVPFAAKPKKGHTCDDLEENYMEVR